MNYSSLNGGMDLLPETTKHHPYSRFAGSRPYSKPLMNKTQVLSKIHPRFFNTISHPRELALLTNTNPLLAKTQPLFLNTIANPREFDSLSAAARPPSFHQMQPLSVRPKRLNNKRSRKPCKENFNGTDDGTRKKQRTRNKNRNCNLPYFNLPTWKEKFLSENNHLYIPETKPLGKKSVRFEASSTVPQSEPLDLSRNCRHPAGLERQQIERDCESQLNYERYERQDTNECFGILHAKMDPEERPVCAFCKRNNAKDYHHLLKDNLGGVVCPVLSAFTCKMCAATGRNAHTHKYCPVNPITKGDPIAAGMPPGRPLTKDDKQWLKYFHAKFILDLYFRNHGGLPLTNPYEQLPLPLGTLP